MFRPPLPATPASADLATYRSNDPVFDARYDEKIRRVAATLDRLREVPGILAAASLFRTPVVQPTDSAEEILAIDDRSLMPVLPAHVSTVSPAFVRALGATLVAGEAFDYPDHARASDIAIVNETMAARIAPSLHIGEVSLQVSAVGRVIATRSSRRRIIGVIRDFVHASPDVPAVPQVFEVTHRAAAASLVAIRTEGPPSSALPRIRSRLEDIWGPLPPQQFSLMVDAWHASLAPFRNQALLLGVIVALTLPLAAIGVAGALSQFLHDRQQEIAIRTALGAPPRSIRRWVVRVMVTTVGFGAAAGVMLGAGAGAVLQHRLFQVQPLDMTTVIAVAAGLTGIVALVLLAPVLRLSRLDPARVLRSSVP
jgi:hypothetical protein